MKGIGRNKTFEALRERSRTVAVDGDVIEAALIRRRQGDIDDDDLAAARLQGLRSCLQELAPQARSLIDAYYQQQLSVKKVAQYLRKKGQLGHGDPPPGAQ